MINPELLFTQLTKNKINHYFGVPDSCLKDFCAYVTDNAKNHIIAANEGNAIGLAAGHYMATNQPAVVYMQNSGLGNCVNPLTSLTDKQVYSIPMLLIIGWRGEPGKKDEPQHVKKGAITQQLLQTMGIPYQVLSDDPSQIPAVINQAAAHMQTHNEPYALLVPKGVFEKYKLQNDRKQEYEMNREDAVQLVAQAIGDNAIVVSTTGKTSRELFEFRAANQSGHHRDFLTVGSMGHASSIAASIALQQPERHIYCFDGDGAFIMHLGALTTVGQHTPQNFTHIVINNEAHDSVGGQPTAADNINIPAIALACGYTEALQADSKADVLTQLSKLKNIQGPTLLEIKCNKGARSDLGRPTRTPIENKNDFMRHVQNATGTPREY